MANKTDKKNVDRMLKAFEIVLNLSFILIFSGAVLFCATELGESILIREILFWTTMIIILVLKIQPSVSFILDSINDWNVERLEKKDAKGGLNE